MLYEDRTYHGIQWGSLSAGKWEPARILVESAEKGPTERLAVKVLRELVAKDEDELGGFGWGYNGSGTSRAAAVILADALGLGDPDRAGISMVGWPQDEVLVRLREDFCIEVLSQLCDQWRLRHITVARWAAAWYTQAGISPLPTALRQLPQLR